MQDDSVFFVPEVIFDLSSKQVLTCEFVEGISLEKAEDLDQETRNYVSNCVEAAEQGWRMEIQCEICLQK